MLTDGESQPFPVDSIAAALKRARIRPVLIRLGNASERVFTPAGRAETYRPARGTGVELARTALLLRASAYAEPEAQAAIAEVADAVAEGDGVAQQSTTSVRELSLPLALAGTPARALPALAAESSDEGRACGQGFVVLAPRGLRRRWRRRPETLEPPVGTGADRAWVLRPEGTPKSVVVFVHGLGGPQEILPTNHLPWLRHLVEQGNAVIYPAYETEPVARGPSPTSSRASGTGCASSATRRFRSRASATRAEGGSSSSGPRCSGRRPGPC